MTPHLSHKMGEEKDVVSRIYAPGCCDDLRALNLPESPLQTFPDGALCESEGKSGTGSVRFC